MRTKMPELTYTKGELRDLIRENPGFTVAVLLRLYDFQTEDEQALGGTVHQNGVGFNGADGPIMTDLVRWYRNKGYLTYNQLNYCRRALPKYLGQVDGLPFVPASFQDPYGQKAVSPDTPKEQEQARAELKNGSYVLTFPFDRELIARVKGLSGRRFESEPEPHWIAPISLDNHLALRSWGFVFTGDMDGLPALIKEASEKLDKIASKSVDDLFGADKVEPAKPFVPIAIPGLKRELFHYQNEGVQFVEDRLVKTNMARALIGDDMGLGKTAQALAVLQLHPEWRDSPASTIIVCPATLKLNWEREALSWTDFGKHVQILEGRYSPDVRIRKPVVIINYDILPNKYLYASGDFSWVDSREKVRIAKAKYVEIHETGWVDHLIKLGPKAVITDESHYWKNTDAARTSAVMALAKASPHFLALSGTPIENRPAELFNVINAIDPHLFPNFFQFAKRYCGAVNNGYGWDFSGASNTKELNEKLRATIMIRRKKCDVLKDLPPKIRSVVPLEITNRSEYSKAETDFIEWVTNKYGAEKAESVRKAEALTRIEGLKQLAVKGKLSACVDWIKNFLDSGEKLVVFTLHQNVIEHLMKTFGKTAVKVDGSVPPGPKRQAAVDAFQTDPEIKLFLGNLIAAGEGLTLTAASNTCTIELEWRPSKHTQAEDRVHRIGQTADSVTAFYLLAEGTIEEEIAALIDEKRGVLAQVLDGEEAVATDLFTDLMNRYKKAA